MSMMTKSIIDQAITSISLRSNNGLLNSVELSIGISAEQNLQILRLISSNYVIDGQNSYTLNEHSNQENVHESDYEIPDERP